MTSQRSSIHLRWLIKLRWGAVIGQSTAIVLVDRLMDIHVPFVPLFTMVGIEAASNVALAMAQRRSRGVSEQVLGLVMSLDVVLLTGLLYFSGGPFNPFSFLYLVQIALASVVLRPRWTWMLGGLSLACFGALYLNHVLLPFGGAELDHAQQMRMHLQGMWVAFAVAAGFISYFLTRVTGALAQREAELSAARDLAARNARITALATLAAGAAHELSTPLSTIAVAAKELERELDGAAAEDAKLIRDQVKRCQDILALMGADIGHSRAEPMQVVDVRMLVESAVEALPKRGGVSCTVGGKGAPLALPEQALSQALRSVLKNAIEASPDPGHVRVGVEVEGGLCRVQVADQGPGMPPDVLGRAGEPFFTTKGPGEGMGLGLFLARAIVERLGGRLELDSAPGRGTNVVLSFRGAERALASAGVEP